MSEEILINVTPMECRVAHVENGVVQELYVERTAKRGLVGNIYKGKVVRVLPGMQAGFIDIGLERTAFIHASDIVVAESDPEKMPTISALLHDGQSIVVQTIKDQIGTKGARLSTDLSIPSRYLVYMPKGQHIGVSQRIEDETERERLKNIIRQLKKEYPDTETGGFIVRTVAEGVSEHELRQDMAFLVRLWRWINERCVTAATPSLIYEELPLFLRVIRDIVVASVSEIHIDSRETYAKVKEFIEEFMPDMVDKLRHYPGERPLFELYNIEDDLQKALQRKVLLKSGGYLIIDQTEAMTTVDVNTGSFVGGRNLEDTVFKTNLEAAHAIARQLRLRNLGGIIILDFIDMQEDDHKQQVLRALEKMLLRDHAKTKITQVSELGLIEMTRQRTRESLEHLLCETCAHCQGRGTVKTPETICYEVFREILREARAYDAANGYRVVANQKVIDRLLSEESAAVADLELFIGKPIKFLVEALYSQEQYDIVLL
jgi:ribonuclease G